ncbi:MAG: PASTA domain-containing protein [Ruminococcaceae bacterium]|nr:PASTA domain-containing protein [Oscillospiraceae bacterium]
MKKSDLKGRNTAALTKKRILYISLALITFLSILISNLFKLQISGYDYYKEKVYDQITTTSPLKANRGKIYDANMNLLATSDTDWRIFISTKDIKKAEKETKKKYSSLIAIGLADILDLSSDKILEKIQKTNVLDVTVKKSVSEKEYIEVLDFIKKNSLEKLVFTEAQSSRYYPEQTLAAHLIGFTGSDNQGLYGLEYYYDDLLKGKNGYYLYAKDANGNALDTEYSTYIPSEDGYSLISTIDSYVQTELESQLEAIVQNHSVQNRVTGIVIDTESGAILAMATSSPFNPNDPYTLDELSAQKLALSGFSEGSEEYLKLKRELLEVLWSNKAISETYEPGSTFKIVTVSCALDTGAASVNDKFSCHGYYKVGGWHIKCHKVTGHGSGFNLAYGLQMSCNPTMMQIAERIGKDTFYEYIEKFGYFEKSGIDLPSESATIFHELENIGSTELATISFGQRFKVSVINHLRAICAVANGGNLITPYVVDKVIDSSGNIISEHSPEVKRQVISESTASLVAQILEEGVSGDGGAKNARVEGYKIAAKTGTSQKFDVLDANGNSYLRIGSTVAFAPSDESGIAAIIVVDEPTCQVKYGSVVAAPYISNLFEKILPYLEYESSEEKTSIEIDNYIGLSTDEAEKHLKDKNLSYEIVGSGTTVIAQTPGENDVITYKHSKIILYTVKEEEYVTVPNLVGLVIDEATKKAIESGLNIKITGSFNGGYVVSQSLPIGAVVKRGEVIHLYTMVTDFED